MVPPSSKLHLISIGTVIVACSIIATYLIVGNMLTLFRPATQGVEANNGEVLGLLFQKPIQNIDISLQLGQIKTTEVDQVTSQTPIQFNERSNSADFVSLADNTLTLSPSRKEHLGTYLFSLETPDSVYSFKVQVGLEQVDSESINNQLNALVEHNKEYVSYYIYDTHRNLTFELNSDEIFLPASITKLSYALLILKDIDNGILTLDQTFPIRGYLKAYESDLLYNYTSGSLVTVREYLELLLQQSDNTAMLHLEDILGGYEAFVERQARELALNNFLRFPNQGTTKDAYKLLRTIYDSEFLSPGSRQFLVDTMSSTDSKYDDRMVAGVPDTVQVAHKIGNLVSDKGLAVNDAGIVFGTNNDLLIVVMTRDMDSDPEGNQIIAKITELAYELLN